MKTKKKNQKSYMYPAIGVATIIIIFIILNFWSIGDPKNYKKISEFKSGILSKDFKFKQFPPNELLGLKLYDDFEKYLLVNKSEIKINEKNNHKYYDIGKKNIKFTNPFPEYFEDFEFVANEDGKLVGIFAGRKISLKNNNNFLNFCTKTRNLFLKQHNLSKLNFINEYYNNDMGDFYDFKSYDFQIDNKSTRFSIICSHDINISSIDYTFFFFFYDINLFKDLMIQENIKITSKK